MASELSREGSEPEDKGWEEGERVQTLEENLGTTVGSSLPHRLISPTCFSQEAPYPPADESEQILTQWLDSRGCIDTLACWIRNCSLAIQQRLDGQDSLIVHS